MSEAPTGARLSSTHSPSSCPKPRVDLACACSVLLATAFLLTYRLTEFPPGLHVDAAVEGFNVQNVLRGHPAVFFPINMGHGAAYVYFEAALIALAGTHRITYGFAAFAMAMLGVAVTFRLFKLMLGTRVAILTAAFMGTSLWVVFISRIGVWQTMMPAATAAPLYFLFRTFKWGRQRDALFGGVALGISQYAYYAIRFLPLLVVALCVVEWAVTRKRARLLAEYVVVSLVAFLPEGVYFAFHPEVVLMRPKQVTIFSANLAETVARVAHGVVSTAGMFFVRGDYRGWQSIPFRPVFDPAMAALFCLGLLVSLVRWRDMRYRWLVLWLGVMLMPTIFTSSPPSNFRAFGAAPVTFAFPALALVLLWDVIGQPKAAGLIAAVIIGLEGYVTYDVYFQRWGTSTEAYAAFDAQDTAIAKFAEDHAGSTIYFSDIRTLGGQPVRALVTETEQQGWYPEDSATIPIPSNRSGDVLYVGSPRSAIGTLAPEWLPEVQTLATTTPTNPRGMWAFRWPAAARDRLMQAQRPLTAALGDDLLIKSYSMQRQAGSVALDVLWEQLHPSGPYDLYTHVFDASGNQVAQGDKLYFPVEVLGLKERPGEGIPTDDFILTRYDYVLGPGHYVVEIGAVHRSPDDLGVLLAPAGPPVRLPVDVPP